MVFGNFELQPIFHRKCLMIIPLLKRYQVLRIAELFQGNIHRPKIFGPLKIFIKFAP